MTYSANEIALEAGTPVELYEFTQVDRTWRYCSGVNEVQYLSNIYNPSSVTRDNIKQTTDTFKEAINITFPKSNEFASQYLTYPPDSVTTLTIYRGHLEDIDGQFIAYWKGRVVGAKTSAGSITLQCESVFTSVRRIGLRARFEYNCRHALYSVGCGVSKTLYKVTGTIVSVTDAMNFTVAEAASLPDGYYNAGIVVFEDGTQRFITNHVGSNITIARPYSSLVGGLSVDLHPGCDHTKESCLNKFNNLNNFGGFPWIPIINPYGGSSIV